MTFTEYLLCAKYGAMSFTWIILIFTTTMYHHAHFPGEKTEAGNSLIDQPKVTQLANGEGGIQTHAATSSGT